MLTNRDKYLNQIALVLASTNLNEIEELQEIVKSERDRSEMTIGMPKLGVSLCSNAEDFFLKSLENGYYIIVNDYLVVKFWGQFISAYATKTFTTHTGVTFVEGCWYNASNELIPKLESAFTLGNQDIRLKQGKWYFMRPLKQENLKALAGPNLSEIAKEKVHIQIAIPNTILGRQKCII